MHDSKPVSRRCFAEKSTIIAAGAIAFPSVLTAKKDSRQVFIGEGGHKYEVLHNWAKLPDKFSWQTTHNVAVDKDENLYVIHEGRLNMKEHPSIFVFDKKGKFVRAFGQQFQGGGHGLEVRTEGKEQFLYVTGYLTLKTFAKLTLTGETVWQRRAPFECGLYPKGKNTDKLRHWGRDVFLPTNFAFLDDGGFFLVDGYGTFRIHRYDQDANWKSMFGAIGRKDGEFQTSHGLWIDNRSGEKKVVVADRANKRLQWFTMAGTHIKTLDGFILPANIDIHGDTMLVPDLSARITLLDKNDQVITHLGEDADWRAEVMKDRKALRREPRGKGWRSGRFLHPHDACFDPHGSIFVAEWVHTGRVSKLRKLS
ncbi:MAG: hypothetical protein CMO80_12410 [Verrucomicrobiales bacterium]|nr:hypothetical protein [Verrucomicrobiales bacterium]|tara:strand:+ start:890 stop:1990 length:1101 start_codon:yes stop_codon:yes gene_type:complete